MSEEQKNDVLQEDVLEQEENVVPVEADNVQQDEKADGKKAKRAKKPKKVLTPEQKKKRTVKALIITGSVLLAIAIFISGCAIANAVGVNAIIKQAQSFERVEYTEHTQLVPTKDADGYWAFTADRDLKVLQFTDVHIGGGCFSQDKDTWAMNAVATMIRKEQPDLVVVTGDIAYPVPFQAGTFNNLNATEIFANMMEKLGVYWTFAFGNHDTEAYSRYTREDICEYYEGAGFKYCLFDRGFSNDERGYGNTAIKVKNSAGIITQALIMLDSHSYTDGDIFGMAWKYDSLHASQTQWYVETMDSFVSQNVENGGENTPVKNLAFFHIPLEEYRLAWKEIKEHNPNLSNNAQNQMTENIENTENVKYIYGIIGESDKTKNGVRTYGIFCGYKSEDFFEQGMTHGLQGTFCGHDHYNNFSVEYKGIRLTYGMSIDYLAYPGIYKEHLQRGCTIITVSTDGTFDCHARNYYSYGVEHEKD